jgi:hypothetical protein
MSQEAEAASCSKACCSSTPPRISWEASCSRSGTGQCRDTWKEKPLTTDIDEVARGSFKRKEPPESRVLGYVVRSLEAALWTFDESVSFEDVSWQ